MKKPKYEVADKVYFLVKEYYGWKRYQGIVLKVKKTLFGYKYIIESLFQCKFGDLEGDVEKCYVIREKNIIGKKR